MLRTFNSGIGMCLVCAADKAEDIARAMEEAGEQVVHMGTVEAGQGVRYTGSLG